MKRTVEEYLAMGFDRPMAEYYAAGKKKLVHIVANDDFTLTLTFDNGETRLYDMSPVLKPGTVFEPFMQIENFRRAYLDDTHCIAWDIDPNIARNVVWGNKVDICPDSCYVDSKPVEGGKADV